MPKKKTGSLDYELVLPSQHELIKLAGEDCQNKPVYIVLRYNQLIITFYAEQNQVDIINQNQGILQIYSNQILRGSENIN